MYNHAFCWQPFSQLWKWCLWRDNISPNFVRARLIFVICCYSNLPLSSIFGLEVRPVDKPDSWNSSLHHWLQAEKKTLGQTQTHHVGSHIQGSWIFFEKMLRAFQVKGHFPSLFDIRSRNQFFKLNASKITQNRTTLSFLRALDLEILKSPRSFRGEINAWGLGHLYEQNFSRKTLLCAGVPDNAVNFTKNCQRTFERKAPGWNLRPISRRTAKIRINELLCQ